MRFSRSHVRADPHAHMSRIPSPARRAVTGRGRVSAPVPARVSFELRPGGGAAMALTKGEQPLAVDATKENAGDRCNTPTRPPPRESGAVARNTGAQ